MRNVNFRLKNWPYQRISTHFKVTTHSHRIFSKTYLNVPQMTNCKNRYLMKDPVVEKTSNRFLWWEWACVPGADRWDSRTYSYVWLQDLLAESSLATKHIVIFKMWVHPINKTFYTIIFVLWFTCKPVCPVTMSDFKSASAFSNICR